jgi:predicted glycosyltransferase
LVGSHPQGARDSLYLAAVHPVGGLGAVDVSPTVPFGAPHPGRAELAARFAEPYPPDAHGWATYNARYWLDHYEDFCEFFFAQCLPEDHSTKQREDCAGWAAETAPEVLIADAGAAAEPSVVAGWAETSTVPTLVIHGDDDRISPLARAESVARATGGELVVLEGAGHLALARDPVAVNLLVRQFVERVAPPSTATTRWRRAARRDRRALFVCSPIGLGHARRDIAIAQELRRLRPDLQIDWLAQDPVTRMLADAGETVHPASARLASETAHMESESGEHRLHCFQAWRRMDEVLVADFMVFHDVVTEDHYDLVVGDEAWEVDHFLHENPELKRFAYCWLTDFVGWLPMPDGGAAEARLTADYNAEMIEHIARFPRVRDLALFVGSPDDVVDDRFGDGLPAIREWTEAHYRFPGYVTGFDPDAVADRDALRHELGYGPDERVCVVTVGGSGVGGDLLRRVVDGFEVAAQAVPGLRMLVVAGPRIDPSALPAHDGLEVRAYVPGLHRHLAASDLAIVQGGLTTCMELTASRRPFVYVPLRQHFEQQFHVHHRLRRHGAGHRLDYADLDPDLLATTVADQLGADIDYRQVDRGGAANAAAAIAELL